MIVAARRAGFPAALVGEAAFERFLRGDGKGSTGLGLAIAARIVGLHGGRCVAAGGLVPLNGYGPHPGPPRKSR